MNLISRAPRPGSRIDMMRTENSGFHDLHPAAGFVNGELPLGEDRFELLPSDDVESVVLPLRELNALGPLDLAGLETLVLGYRLSLLHIDFFHDYGIIPP